MTRSVGKIDDICRKYSYKIYKSHGATYMWGGVGGRWKESAEVADIFGLMDKFNTFSCIMMSKYGEHFNAYFIGGGIKMRYSGKCDKIRVTVVQREELSNIKCVIRWSLHPPHAHTPLQHIHTERSASAQNPRTSYHSSITLYRYRPCQF